MPTISRQNPRTHRELKILDPRKTVVERYKFYFLTETVLAEKLTVLAPNRRTIEAYIAKKDAEPKLEHWMGDPGSQALPATGAGGLEQGNGLLKKERDP